ncbi:hypothetical protein GCM10010193_06240 [Kitasatospora atroaurantiaca]
MADEVAASPELPVGVVVGVAVGEGLPLTDGDGDGEVEAEGLLLGDPEGVALGDVEGTAGGPVLALPEGSTDGAGDVLPPGFREVPEPDRPVVMSCSGLPAATSTTRIGVIATAKTSAETAAYVFQVQRRLARTVRGAFQSEEISATGSGCGSTAPRRCSPVRLKRCWKTAPPTVAPTLTTAAPMIVPYTPSPEASTAPATVARALAAT